jgi:outer membrane protein assembly factor BamB
MKQFALLFGAAFLFAHFSFAQTNVSGVIATNTTWTKANSPYNLTGNVLVNSGATLTINPGVVVNFSNSKKLTIDGIVLSIGTITDSITFTGTSWNGITTNFGANGSRFKYSIIENATGNSEEVRINLYGTTIIERCRVSNTNQGIMAYNSSQILYSKIYKTQCFGLYLESNSTAIGNDISYLNGCNNSINVNNGSTFSKNKVSNLSGEWGVRVYSGGIVEGNTFTAGTNGGSTSAIFCQGGIGGGGGGGLTYIRFNKFDGFKNNILIARDDVIVNDNSFIGGMNLFTQRNIRTQSGFSGTNVRVDATSNYWANVTALNIPNSIEDYNDDYTLQGNVDYSNSLTYHSPLAPISTPNNIIKKIVGSNIVLTWTANTESDIAGYKIYYGGYTGYSYTTSADAGNVLTYTLPAGVGIDEDIAVTAYDASKDGTDDQFDGNESWYSPANKAPAKTVIATITPTERQVQITWTAEANANKYNIYKSTDSASFTLLTSVVGTTYSDTNLNTLQQRYYYKIAAFDSLDLSYDSYGIEGVHSDIKGAKPTNKPTISSVESFTDAIKLNYTYNSNLAGINSVKIYRSSPTEARALIATLAASATTYTNSVSNDIPYTYDITITNATDESDASIVKTASAFSISTSLSPTNNQLDVKDAHIYKWSKITLATNYKVELDTVNTFSSGALVQKSLSDTSLNITGLIQNQYYYWRIKSGDDNGYSSWSSINLFQTYVQEATINAVIPANKNDTLKFTLPSSKNIRKIYILRDTIDNPTKIIDSSSSVINSYLDTIQLKLNQKYYYSIQLLNEQGVKSNYAKSKNATPFNTTPKTIALSSKTFENTGEFNTIRLVYSATGSNDPDGKITGYKWYVNDSLVNQTDSILIYYFKQGQTDVKLEVTDNDGATNFSTAQIKMSAFVKRFKGGILGGITALDESTLYTADSTFDAVNGASVYKVNRTGTTIYPLIVSSKIFTTPSVSSDSSVFITSGSTLNGFNSSGAPLWSTIPLGGLSYVTPTIDSVQNRLYVGVSNANFFAIDYKTGKVVWNIICDAPINSSAIITGDRKLVFASDNGTLYGFDLRTISGQAVPTWKYTVPGKITKSPAVDSSNQLYFGTLSGNLVKLSLGLNGTVTTLWTVPLGSSVQSSPVIDGKGNVYAGTESGKFYKLNSIDGKIIWTYTSKDAIRSTPAISEYGNVYIADKSGYITSLSENGIVNWKYQDSSAISSNLLTLNSMTYIGTEGGKLIGFYDNPTTNTVNTSLSFNIRHSSLSNHNGSLATVSNFYGLDQKIGPLLNNLYLTPPPPIDQLAPVWGTFQGNYRRTGSKTADCPEKPSLMASGSTTICNGDIVKLTTSAANKFTWKYNDTQLVNAENTPSISVTQPGKYSVLAYGNKNCAVSSDTITIDAQSSPIKAVINGLEMDTVLCFVDSIKLSSSNYYDRYIWSNGDTLQFTTIKISDKISLKGASSGSVCYSLPSTSLSLIKNINVSPQITSVSNSLISTRSNYYKWFKNNKPAAGIVGFTFINPAQGFYKVETSLDNFCWDASADYVVLLNTAPLVNDSVSISTYPNPSSGIFNVVADFEKVTNVVTKVLITDVSGKVIYQSQKLLFFSKKIMIPINLGTNKGSFVLKMDINGVANTINILIN